ncbi:bifunctional DNA-formamidopyrimidine glycosylase/DNA-(apurinic or apyrimidinic site) lyase [Candidatus Pantoea edessiphila]|uniref:Formamidopyrimidine-DNA glycosylase n=1 Tax=Candidatus Pantoea edessiphila TaxID=2044610 RepID=A0A2P5SVL4_9GAMM|nr:bifunctional DNA-formamidopyrimidine glycosylase/DNA-(apurinic or apyrimidinic site) lyase [Candidatus Pantoea edessiphila]PPI86356.1 DNA-formamidopyrimidine glycosylase [Candidatus Pantoea edessiphila]
MPELPEVESYLISIRPYLINQIITRIVVRNLYLRWPISEEILKLRNQLILNIKRRGKYLLIQLQSGWIIIHFGMSGRLSLHNKYICPQKHDHIDILMENDSILRYTDQRRFGALLWTNDLSNHTLLNDLGVEPLGNKFNNNYLLTKLHDIKASIKQSIMNNKIVVGIGNIYANEILFATGIIPMRPSFDLRKEEIEFLVKNIKLILFNAIKCGGTTLRDFVQINGEPGSFIKKLKVYGRINKPCLVCGTLIIKEKYRGRSTYWCPKCQL